MADDDKRPPEGELGSVLAWTDSLFVDYLDPSMGSVAWWEARDYQTMLRLESQARKVEQVLSLPILGAPITIRPGKGDKGEAEWVTDVLTRPANAGGMSTPLPLVVAQATTAFTYRVASFEKVWRTDDDGLTYDKLAFRPPVNTRVVRDRKTGAYQGLKQDPPYGGADPVRIPATRAFTHVHGQHRSPVLGSSDMEIPLVCHKAKQKLRFLWFLFLELHAQPRITAEDTRENAGGSQDATKDAARKLAQLKGGGVIAMPPGVSANVLETAGHAADLYQQALKYLDSEMTGQVLAQFTDLAAAAADGRGSLALSRDQSDLFMTNRRWAATELGSTFTNYVIADLVKWNRGPKAACPSMHIGPLVRPDLEALVPLLDKAGPLPAEFASFIIESTATALDMPADRVAQVVKAAEQAHEQAARNARQEQLAKVTGPVAAAEQIVRKAARQDGEVRGRARAAAAAAGQ